VRRRQRQAGPGGGSYSAGKRAALAAARERTYIFLGTRMRLSRSCPICTYAVSREIVLTGTT